MSSARHLRKVLFTEEYPIETANIDRYGIQIFHIIIINAVHMHIHMHMHINMYREENHPFR